MTSTELASKIDHTLLTPEASAEQVRRLVAEAIEHRFASVCVHPVWVSAVHKMLSGSGSGVLTCTVVGFPLGANKPTLKAIEATSAIKDGASEVDVVAHLPHLINGDLDNAKAELIEIVRAARAARRDVVVKVIVESAALMKLSPDPEQAIATACRAVRESGCDFVKTSTGFHPAGGATVDVVRLMKRYADGILIKASGGIRDLATARAMLDAGAHRLGTSAGVAIVDELRQGGRASPDTRPASGY
jgi:deoxyribose-phosphate aldolase